MINVLKRIKMKKITLKLFLITSTILLGFAFIIYLSLYFFLPTFYNQYKTNQIQTGIEELINDSRDLNLRNAIPLIDDFARKNNAMIYLQNGEGYIIYSPLLSFFEGSSTTPPNVKLDKTTPFGDSNHPVNSYEVTTPIQFQDVTLDLIVSVNFPPIDEASEVLILFLPYISIIVIIIGVGSAYLYSRFITRPLIYINQGAQKMADLDFSEKIEVHSNDELEELSNSLNNLSFNLQQSMLDLKKVNQALKTDIEKERELEKKRRDFFVIVAHELKTPLTVMKGHIEGMLYRIGPYKDRDAYLQKNFQTIREMEQLVREILSMSKLEQHTFKLRIDEVNLAELINSVTNSLSFFASEKNIQIIKQIESPIFVNTDRVLLEKALKNIIHNAIMYTPQNQNVCITLSHSYNQNNVHIRVMNTGVEIKEEDLKHLFEPFYRIEKSRNRNTGGSGLGLYIVKQIFNTLSIRYSLKNTEKGVEFMFIIPLTKK
ncbi:two-component system, OmpR family, sensor histidine kinase VanS [Cytobacillus horneckiae]|uniref:sensor histidine kinase n=1 Tax=Cytobacillus horneckiae TaxID=549687 RepID=UPI0019D0A913|nr:HAMP domain-containing sensor histidine kinase [Cytobacillus horneckiae]MBN6888204.1 HAMP domain-containing protein [Cytobacillus horneckiae]MCM3177060.1 HAMP domain-containing histidine kinase [Cytobacillus horneckiae]